jgi:hypothetical protein
MARENSGSGYDRIAGALANLGYSVSDETVAKVLRRHGIAPAPFPEPSRPFLLDHSVLWRPRIPTGVRRRSTGNCGSSASRSPNARLPDIFD